MTGVGKSASRTVKSKARQSQLGSPGLKVELRISLDAQ
jgi:hypothetical protein